MMSIPVQCTQEIPVYFHEKPQPLAAAAQSPAAQCGVDFFTSNKGTFSNLLAEDMAKLSVDMPHQRKEDDILEQRVAPLLSLDSLRWPEASSNELKTPRKADLAGRDGPLRTTRVGVDKTDKKSSPWSEPSFATPLSKTSCLVLHVCVRCFWQIGLPWMSTSWASLAGCWCQMLHCSPMFVTSARRFSQETQPPEESSYDISTHTSPKLDCFSCQLWVYRNCTEMDLYSMNCADVYDRIVYF